MSCLKESNTSRLKLLYIFIIFILFFSLLFSLKKTLLYRQYDFKYTFPKGIQIIFHINQNFIYSDLINEKLFYSILHTNNEQYASSKIIETSYDSIHLFINILNKMFAGHFSLPNSEQLLEVYKSIKFSNNDSTSYYEMTKEVFYDSGKHQAKKRISLISFDPEKKQVKKIDFYTTQLPKKIRFRLIYKP